MNKLTLLLLTSVLMLSCQSRKQSPKDTKEISLLGNWEYDGFGKGVTISDSVVQSFHLSSVGNVTLSDISPDDYFDYYTVDTLSEDMILLKDGVKTFKLRRSNQGFTRGVNTALSQDPIYNFEILWNTFNEQYCYFTERGIDWKNIYDKYKPQVNDETTPLALFLICEKMIGEIADSHISIDVPDEIEEGYQQQLINVENTTDEVPQGLDKKVKALVVEKHLTNVNSFNQGELKWGMVNDDILYIQTSNMISMAHYDISDTLSKDDFWGEWWGHLNNAKNHHDDVAIGTRYIMDKIVKDSKGAKACIVDVRFNGGGFDDVSIEMLNHFVTKETDICTKKVRLGQGFTEKQKMTLIPSQHTFDGTLYILTSYQTASAAEIFVLGGNVVPDSKTVGAATEGVFSDVLHKKLPNGWTYGLSNMIYETMDGISYENLGIAPDIELAYPKETKAFYEYLYEELQNGDDAIEAVIAEVKAGR